MSIKKVRQHNSQDFINDFKRVRDIVVLPDNTDAFLRVNKNQVWDAAKSCKIRYYMSDKIFRVVRDAMVII